MIELNRIYNEYCLEGMKKIPDRSIDTIITDPPYNIDIAEWDTIYNYEAWMKSLFVEFQRVSRQQIIGHLRGRSHVLGRVQSGADGAGRDRHEGGGMTLQEIAASIAELQANKRRAALENKPERCEGYQRAIDLLDKLAEMKRREQCQQQKTQ